MWSCGKTDRDGMPAEVGGPVWNPLIAHLLDVDAVTLELWDRYLPDPARDRLTVGFGAGDHRAARAAVAFLAALHDLGKASPLSACRFATGRRTTDRMRRERGLWEDQACAAGLPLPGTWAGVQNARHEHITTLTLPGLLSCRCPDTGDGTECRSQEIVIDEAHAYELYQQQLLGAAVEWLADAGARHRRRRRGSRPQERAPAGRGGTAPHDGRPRTDPGPRELAARLLDQARDGGYVGVVRTRVDTAVALYEQARAQAAEYGWDPQDVVLLHGRMLPRDRQPLEERLTAMLGPATDAEVRQAGKPNPDRPGRMLVIATQVIEQSLDLDFDHLVSDLAPIDRLVQRLGRHHRHRANDPQRPAWYVDATHLAGRVRPPLARPEPRGALRRDGHVCVRARLGRSGTTPSRDCRGHELPSAVPAGAGARGSAHNGVHPRECGEIGS
ncbi:HD domain-containing protein [Streptomyces sp. NPDC051567]|uniref:HD domain-containing protein n=1 Tax=Streptomyces sp. NPDC051567 TaxID=3365660 RepID=UPI0037B22581